MVMSRTIGSDTTLFDAPPLRRPPLSLVDLAMPLIDIDDLNAQARDAEEQMLSAQRAARIAGDRAVNAGLEEWDQQAAQAEAEAAMNRAAQFDAWHSDRMKTLANLDRWEAGFTYLPELDASAMEIFVEGSSVSEANRLPATTNLKSTAASPVVGAWYDPFETVAHEDRSAMGLRGGGFELRAQRVMRALLAHEAWQVEHEFWTGAKVPTNYHLTASPLSPTTGNDRTIDAWADPVATPGTTLGVAVGLTQGLASANQAIARSDAGVGMIHATPFMVEMWASKMLLVREQGRVYSINGNLIVPGYGYPGTGPDEQRTVTDGVTNSDTSLTSATAVFTTRDIGASVTGAGIPAGTTIVTVTNGTTVVLSAATTATATGVTITLVGGLNDAGRYQWVYVTDMVYKCKGPARTLPHDISELGPHLNVDNAMALRAERSWAMITNRLLRAGVLVDTQTA